jgi:hypothetical protein
MADRKTTSVDELYSRGRSYPRGGQPRDPGARRLIEQEPSMKSHEVQRNQMPEDAHAPNYRNDCSGWVRGARSGEPTGFDETATNKPSGFDRGNAWRQPDGSIHGPPGERGQQRRPEPVTANRRQMKDGG